MNILCLVLGTVFLVFFSPLVAAIISIIHAEIEMEHEKKRSEATQQEVDR